LLVAHSGSSLPIREVACNYIFKASNVAYKLSIEIGISRTVNLKRELRLEIDYFL
jgi:hypothetical protein